MEGLELVVVSGLLLLQCNESDATNDGKDKDGNAELGTGGHVTHACEGTLLGLVVDLSLVDVALVSLEVVCVVEGAHGLDVLDVVLGELVLVKEVVVVALPLVLGFLLSLLLLLLVIVSAGGEGDGLGLHDLLADLVGLVVGLLLLLLLLFLSVLIVLVELGEGLARDAILVGVDDVVSDGVELVGGKVDLLVVELAALAVLLLVGVVVAVAAGGGLVVVHGLVVDGAVFVEEEADLGAVGAGAAVLAVAAAADEAGLELDAIGGKDAGVSALGEVGDVLGELVVVHVLVVLLLLVLALLLLSLPAVQAVAGVAVDVVASKLALEGLELTALVVLLLTLLFVLLVLLLLLLGLVLLGVAVVLGLLALLAVALALGGLVLDHGLHEVAEGGDPRDVGVAVAVGVVGVGAGDDLEDDVGLLGDGLVVGGVGDDALLVDVVGLDLEVDALLGVDGVVARDLELLLLALELTAGGLLLAVLGDEIVVLHGLGHELGGGLGTVDLADGTGLGGDAHHEGGGGEKELHLG
mmetsp:Transcript_9478/g.15732  ORF Transcript_9478/g.15732 Transcript_9478/m.15732 type:complete len:524 (-) Transcript_9478:42-1613(-)